MERSLFEMNEYETYGDQTLTYTRFATNPAKMQTNMPSYFFKNN